MTRAFCYLVHGRIAKALDYNPLVFVMLAVLVVVSLLGLKALLKEIRDDSK